MPSSLHENLAALIDNDILNQIRELRDSSDTMTAQFAGKISPTRSTTIRLRVADHKYNKHKTDASYRHKGNKFLELMIEIS
jgi:hypothetical protein